MIIDAFTFHNEVDLLEFRLAYLYEHVDRFVISEATHTHRGRPKPLYFADHADRFKPFKDKIRHVLVDDLPLEAPDHWDRENFQRNALKRGLPDNLNDRDWIMISDLDEIPSRHALSKLGSSEAHLVGLRYQLAMFKINRIAIGAEANAVWTVAARASLSSMPQQLRDARHSLSRGQLRGSGFATETIAKAGWHWTYLGDQAFIYEKLNTMLHSEVDIHRVKTELNLGQALISPVDPLGRQDYAWEIVEIDQSFPEPIRQAPENYADWILSA